MPLSSSVIDKGSTVAWLGLGTMGVPMARRLFSAGYHLRGYNRTSRPDFSDLPFPLFSSPAECLSGSPLVILMVRDGIASRELLEGERGVLSAISPGQIVVNMSTIAPEEAREEARRVREKEGIYFDIPVSGSVVPAGRGELLLLAGGEEQFRSAIEPPLSVLGSKLHWFGPAGSGMAAKLAINFLLASHMQSLVEVLSAGEGLGLDKKELADAISDSPLATPFSRIKFRNLLEENYAKAFSASLMEKDLDLLERALGPHKPSLPSLSIVHALYQKALEDGLGEQDLSIIQEILKNSPGNS